MVAAGLSLPRDASAHVISFGSWFVAGEYSFELRLLADPLSLIFSTLCALLIGVVAAFAGLRLRGDRLGQRPRPPLPPDPRAVELEERPVEAALPRRQRPVGDPLIEERRR